MKNKKQRQIRDHKNYDYLTITAKVEREEEIIASYATLGWEKVKVTEDKRFFDLTSWSSVALIRWKTRIDGFPGGLPLT